jgi:hypothetical protein
MAGIDLRRERYERDFEMINDDNVIERGVGLSLLPYFFGWLYPPIFIR